MDVAPVEPAMPVPPPMDGTADHPDHYIPEPVRHFLPYFHKQVMEKVYHICNSIVGIQSCVAMTLSWVAFANLCAPPPTSAGSA